MRKILTVLALSLILLMPVQAEEYWPDTYNRPVLCCEDRSGCQVLQTVMMGSFADFDPADSLSVRVFSAALVRLTSVTEEDFIHFSKYFDEDEKNLKRCYYTTLGNCLWADSIINPNTGDAEFQNARRVLLLFLNPGNEADASAQMNAIREAITDEEIAILAEKAAVPEPFVRYLILEEYAIPAA